MTIDPPEHPTDGAAPVMNTVARVILDAVVEGVLGVDGEGVVTFANPAASALLGYEAAALVGKRYQTLLRPGRGADDLAGVVSALLRQECGMVAGRAEFVHATGEFVRVEYTCSPASGHDQGVGAVVAFRDVSDRLRAEDAVRRTEWVSAVEHTVQAFRHEINNPLSALLAGVQLLEMGGNTPEEEQEMIGAIGVHARRIRDAVRRLTVAPPAPGDPLGGDL